MSGLIAILLVGGAIVFGSFLGWQISKMRRGDDPDTRALGTFLLMLMVACGGIFSFMSDGNTSSPSRFSSIPTETKTDWHDLILNETTTFLFDDVTRVMMRYSGEEGQAINIQVVASDESEPLLGIVISNTDEGSPRVYQNFMSPDPNVMCEYVFLQNSRHTFFFEAHPDIEYTVHFQSGSDCDEK